MRISRGKAIQFAVLTGLSVLFFGLMRPYKLEARIIGTNPTGASADVWCVNSKASSSTSPLIKEICIDASGNVIPTTDQLQNSGTSSLRWNAVNSYSVTVGTGGFNSTGSNVSGTAGAANTAGTGTGTAATAHTVNGTLVFAGVQVGACGSPGGGVYASTTVPVASSYEILCSSGANVGITASPNISTTVVVGGANLANGTYLVLTSTSANIVRFYDKDTQAGSALQLGAATRDVSADKNLVLIFNSGTGFWDEVSYGNN